VRNPFVNEFQWPNIAVAKRFSKRFSFAKAENVQLSGSQREKGRIYASSFWTGHFRNCYCGWFLNSPTICLNVSCNGIYIATKGAIR